MPNWKSYESSVRLLSAIVAAHPGLKLDYGEIQQHFGSDVTLGALRKQFQLSVNKNVNVLREARAAGKDCKNCDLGLDTPKGQATAREYGEGVSANLGGASAKTTPKKRGTPNKRKSTAAKKTAICDDDDSDDEEQISPKKQKTVLSKVCSGRVTKSSGRNASKVINNYDKETDENEEMGVKEEDQGFEKLAVRNRNGVTAMGNGDAYDYNDAESTYGNYGSTYNGADLEDLDEQYYPAEEYEDA